MRKAYKKTRLLFGVGMNDADYAISQKVGEKQVRDPFYACWQHMLARCYDKKTKQKYPTYADCTASPDWLLFSNFRDWMRQQDWQGKHLDKDLLVPGNKIYSPSTCVFVSHHVNLFLTDSAAVRGIYPLGVSWSSRRERFQARCGNPLTKNREFLGWFICPLEAHEAWRKRKHEVACELAELQSDPRVATALRARFSSTIAEAA